MIDPSSTWKEESWGDIDSAMGLLGSDVRVSCSSGEQMTFDLEATE